MENPIKQIYKFNKEAGFLASGCNPWLESAYQIEEALEGFDIPYLAYRLGYAPDFEPNITAKDLSRYILGSEAKETVIAEVDTLDKACDHVVFAVGAMAKLGLSAQQITLAINTVMQANFAKVRNPQYDSEGKLVKPENFQGPEAKLQEILDARST